MVITYLLVCLVACTLGQDPNTGAPLTVGANTVVNRVLWDGITTYTLPAGTRIIANDGTAIGSVTSH